MNYETLRLIFMISAILAGISLLASILIFIFLKIPSVVGDLSGATARKAIKEIREGNELSGNKIHKASTVNKARGKLTDKISSSGNLIRSDNTTAGFAMGTQKISTAQLSAEAMEAEANVQTTILERDTNVTDFGTTILSKNPQFGSETTVLGSDSVSAETSVLNQNVSPVSGNTVSSYDGAFSKNIEATVSLSNGETAELSKKHAAQSVSHVFELLYDITIINTQEIIP